MLNKKTKNKVYTADQIFAVAKLLQQVYDLYPAITIDQKATRSIAFDLEEKFSSKRKQLIKNHTLFEDKSTHKIKLKYHEELGLQRIIFDLINTVNSQQAKFNLQVVHDYLHQKLA
ncbi:hypothetical protein [Flavobacterium sp. UBA6046]|jgi:hypothetical protein|uniref:hypothetical protein n=1 Tax=Flavobacterium sp. UBA6046 TaxID=1946552 RepID=UPI0025C55274|nr:hypothetical protein [Flavobacterium sp. UBA6046]